MELSSSNNTFKFIIRILVTNMFGDIKLSKIDTQINPYVYNIE